MKILTLYLTSLIISAIPTAIFGQEIGFEKISWSIADTLPNSNFDNKSIGLAGAISGFHNNALIVAGGNNFPSAMPWMGGKKKYYSDVFIYEKSNSNQLVLLPERFKLPYSLAYAAVCSTPMGIIVAGGENKDGASKKVLFLDWAYKKRNLKITDLPDLPIALTNASITVLGNIAYLAGGENAEGVSDLFYSLDLTHIEKGWEILPKLPHPVSHTVLLSVNSNINEIFLIGGRKRNDGDLSTLYSNVYVYSLAKKEWVLRKSLPYPLAAASGVAYQQKLFVFSGDKGETFHKAEALIAQIAKESNEVKKENLNQQKIKVQATHPGFSKSVLAYDIKNNSWSVLDQQMISGPVTTNAVLWDNEVIITGGEIKAGVRSNQILVGKIK